MLDQKNYKILDPSYAKPEEHHIPFEPKLLLLDKKKYLQGYTSNNKRSTTNQKTLSPAERKFVILLDLLKHRYYKSFD